MEKKLRFSTLKTNILFYISVVSYFCASMVSSVYRLAGGFVACILFLLFCMKEEKILSKIKKIDSKIILFSIITTLGICTALSNISISSLCNSAKLSILFDGNNPPLVLFNLLGIVFSIVAFPAVFFFVCQFWNFLVGLFKDLKVFEDVPKSEFIFYGIVIFILSVFACASFFSSNIFYGNLWDLVYTSDHPHLIDNNVYFHLYQSENDIRQPFFAILASPLLGAFYPFLQIFPKNTTTVACFLGIAQIAVLIFTFFLVAKMMDLPSSLRASFVLFCCSSYTALLSCIMFEQYVVATFYLVLFLFTASKNIKSKTLLFAAGGTLLTSFFFFPLTFNSENLKSFKAFFVASVKFALSFIFAILLLGRFDVILTLIDKLKELTAFSGKGFSLYERFMQFSVFLKNIFATPETIILSGMGISAWRLAIPTQINPIGIGIFITAAISVILNRKKIQAKIFGAWAIFSLLLLGIVGFGSSENGQILYSLYFFWTYAALIFMLCEWILKKIHFERVSCHKHISFVIICIASIVLLVLNVPCIKNLIIFAHSCYPLNIGF